MKLGKSHLGETSFQVDRDLICSNSVIHSLEQHLGRGGEPGSKELALDVEKASFLEDHPSYIVVNNHGDRESPK